MVADSRPVLPAAVLWDMDGTLVETEPLWIEAEEALVNRYGGTWARVDTQELIGNNLIDSGRHLRDQGGVDLEPEAIIELLLDDVTEMIRHEVPWRPGALELLGDLRRSGVRCGLVTMSYRRFVQPVLDALPEGSFEAVVTGDAVSRGKPHPEPYLAAARLLRVEPTATVAIEDSNTGTRSAETAGCRVLVVPNHVPIPPGPRRVFAHTLEGMDAAALARLTATVT
ncbi:MAG: HAD family hydrolase [Nocardioidaceae bacterium]